MLIVLVVSMVPMLVYVRSTRERTCGMTTLTRSPSAPRPRREAAAIKRWWRNPWRKPWVLGVDHRSCYLAWSLLPVLVAVLFSFNAGRSRVTWQGFSMRWYYGDPLRSVWHDDSLHTALIHTLWLGIIVTVDHGAARA